MQDGIGREAAKRSVLSSGKTDKYEYLTGEQILSSDQRKMIKQGNLAYSPLEKALENQTRTNWRARETQNRCYCESKQETSGFNQ